MEAVGRQAVATMQAALAAMQESRDLSAPCPSRQLLHAATEGVKAETSKLGLMLSSSTSTPAPPVDQVAAMLQGLQRAVTALCSLCAAAHAAGGPTLRSALGGERGVITSLIHACVSLVQAAVVEGQRGEGVVQLTGLCLQRAVEAAKAPLDNKSAIGRALMVVLRQLKDAERELQQACNSDGGVGMESEEDECVDVAAHNSSGAGDGVGVPALANGHTNDDQHLEDGDWEWDAVGQSLSPSERGVVEGTCALVKAAHELLAALVRRLLSTGDGRLLGETCEAWESLLFHVRVLAGTADELAAGAIMPPHDSEEIAAAAEAVSTGCDLIAEECEGLGAGEDVGGGPTLRQCLSLVLGAHASLLELL
jgi:hypothetical protein